MNKITPLPVERDQYGYWTHPLYDEFCDGRESITSEEFNAWLDKNGLAWTVVYRDEDDIDPRIDGYDISTWQPEPRRAKVGLLDQFTTLKMARYASGCVTLKAVPHDN